MQKRDLSSGASPCDGGSVPPEPESEIMTPESLAIQIIQENQELVTKYGGGDATALGILEEKILRLGAGRVNEGSLKDTLVRKLGSGY